MPRHAPLIRFAMAAVAVLAVGACGGSAPLVERNTPFAETRPQPDRITVRVDNRNFSDARLYAVGTARRIPMGVVGGKEITVFTVPWEYSQPLRIEIDLFAGGKCLTRMIEADPGDTLDLQIESAFDRTGLCA